LADTRTEACGGQDRHEPMKRLLTLLILASFGLWIPVKAHEVRPAYLELRQTAADSYDVLWKVPARGENLRLGIYVHLPDDVKELTPPVALVEDGAYLERWKVQRPGGLDGQTIKIGGLSSTKIDVLARIERENGVTQTTRVTPDAPAFVVEATPSNWRVSATYLGLGIEHILLGIDHLLFVLALVLLVKGWKRLVGTITAFTVAHSLTLAAATLGFVHLPGPPVEACIALSIVFVAAEIVRGRQGQPGLTARAPWVVAFSFGLLHGLGFASALSEVGLPQQAIPLALLFFNVGVELGQLAFIGVVLGIMAGINRLPVRSPAWGWRLVPYSIGAVAMFWVIQRTTSF